MVAKIGESHSFTLMCAWENVFLWLHMSVLSKGVVNAWALCVSTEFISPMFTTVPRTEQTANINLFHKQNTV